MYIWRHVYKVYLLEYKFVDARRELDKMMKNWNLNCLYFISQIERVYFP